MSPCLTCSAHPRVGGENHGSSKKRECDIGSSPRGRGKPQRWRGSPCGCRLIPAWAGKTHTRRWSAVEAAAHPRVGGENLAVPYSTEIELGSSPRGRGKRLVVILGCCCVGLIPAWAGKTSSGCASSSPHRAHPRVGGENPESPSNSLLDPGSSPRGRGKRRQLDTLTDGVRLIPAWAGKTPVAGLTYPTRWAHPRVGGENVSEPPSMAAASGSSPRGRGKLNPVAVTL